MKKLERSALVPYSAQKMYELVNNIEAYPEFMTGCNSTTILSKSDEEITAKLSLGQGSFNQTLTTRNTLTPGKAMKMVQVDGPFKSFEGLWLFEPVEDNACKLTFALSYQFSNPLIGMAAGKMMETLANDQVDAICQRAKTIYSS